MRVVLQRVRSASVCIEGGGTHAIGRGLVVLLGIHKTDTEASIPPLATRIPRLRLFDDAEGQMNLDLAAVGGEVLVVSNFTLHGRIDKGTRPSWSEAARPEVARPLYERFVEALRAAMPPGSKVATGEFGASMQVVIANDGPVTLVLDSP
jgi:D-tyrosyl-tRNA(Tyr) deacylase